MKSMKMTPEEKKGSMGGVQAKMPSPAYPYGLRIELNQDALAKLGIDLPKVGDKIEFSAVAECVACHASENEDKTRYASCTLQITDMETSQPNTVKEIASRLYKKGE